LLDTIGLNGFTTIIAFGGMRSGAHATSLTNRRFLLDEPLPPSISRPSSVENDMARLVRSQRRSLLLITRRPGGGLPVRSGYRAHSPAGAIRAIHEINIDVDRTDMMAARDPVLHRVHPFDMERTGGPAPNMNIERRDIASAAVDVSSDATLTVPKPHRRGRRFRALRGNVLVLACQIAVLVVLLASWQFATANYALSAFLFGSPSAIWGFLVQMRKDGSLLTDTRITALETLLGFCRRQCPRHAGRACAMVFAFRVAGRPALRRRPRINPNHRACTNLHHLVRHRSRLESRMATLSVVVVALITAYKGAMTVDVDQINMMRTLGASKRHIFRKLIVPASLGDIFAGLKLTVGFALIGAIIGEFMSSSEGLGHAIFKAGSLYIIPKVFAALVVTIALALCLTYVVGKIEKLLTPATPKIDRPSGSPDMEKKDAWTGKGKPV
jgi:NitT/TauT family transport system permease protein